AAAEPEPGGPRGGRRWEVPGPAAPTPVWAGRIPPTAVNRCSPLPSGPEVDERTGRGRRGNGDQESNSGVVNSRSLVSRCWASTMRTVPDFDRMTIDWVVAPPPP